jgi:hypothetical protein
LACFSYAANRHKKRVFDGRAMRWDTIILEKFRRGRKSDGDGKSSGWESWSRDPNGCEVEEPRRARRRNSHNSFLGVVGQENPAHDPLDVTHAELGVALVPQERG